MSFQVCKYLCPISNHIFKISLFFLKSTSKIIFPFEFPSNLYLSTIWKTMFQSLRTFLQRWLIKANGLTLVELAWVVAKLFWKWIQDPQRNDIIVTSSSQKKITFCIWSWLDLSRIFHHHSTTPRTIVTCSDYMAVSRVEVGVKQWCRKQGFSWAFKRIPR